MKSIISLLISLFVLSACTGSTTTTSDNVGPVQTQKTPSPIPTPTPDNSVERLAQDLQENYNRWQSEYSKFAEKKSDQEALALYKELFLGKALRGVYKLNTPEKVLMVRADFKNRQGPQSEKDFLPLAKKILEKN